MSSTADTGSESARTVRLQRTVLMIAAALERRRQKIAAGLPVEPPPECDCAGCATPEGRRVT